jgi:hypothetical protein
MHFPAKAGLIFLTDELTNDRYLFDTGATLSIVPCNLNSSPSVASRWGRSHSGHCLFEKILSHCCSRDQPNPVCLHCSGLACPLFVFSGLARPLFTFSSIVRFACSTYSSTGSSSGCNSAACYNNFFPASCHIHTCSLESPGEVVQL